MLEEAQEKGANQFQDPIANASQIVDVGPETGQLSDSTTVISARRQCS